MTHSSRFYASFGSGPMEKQRLSFLGKLDEGKTGLS